MRLYVYLSSTIYLHSSIVLKYSYSSIVGTHGPPWPLGAVGPVGQEPMGSINGQMKPEIGLINPEIGLNRLSNAAVSSPHAPARTGKGAIQSTVQYPIDHSKMG